MLRQSSLYHWPTFQERKPTYTDVSSPRHLGRHANRLPPNVSVLRHRVTWTYALIQIRYYHMLMLSRE